MQDYILEICADSAESAIAAEKGGATRLELCQNLIIGGTTPGPKLFDDSTSTQWRSRLHVLIRPRFGDFCYSDYEMEQIKEEIKMFRELGADGVVIGVLSPDGSIDRERMERLLEERGDMSVTLHPGLLMSAGSVEITSDGKRSWNPDDSDVRTKGQLHGRSRSFTGTSKRESG